MTNRRDFILKSVMSAGAFSAFSLFQEVHAKNFDHFYKSSLNPPDNFEKDEDFWTYISQSYTVNPSVINLNNGGVSPAPKIVQDALIRYNALSNEGPSYYMWRILDQGREP